MGQHFMELTGGTSWHLPWGTAWMQGGGDGSSPEAERDSGTWSSLPWDRSSACQSAVGVGSGQAARMP